MFTLLYRQLKTDGTKVSFLPFAVTSCLISLIALHAWHKGLMVSWSNGLLCAELRIDWSGFEAQPASLLSKKLYTHSTFVKLLAQPEMNAGANLC